MLSTLYLKEVNSIILEAFIILITAGSDVYFGVGRLNFKAL